MILEYSPMHTAVDSIDRVQEQTPVVQQLVIAKKEVDRCGSTHYYANLPKAFQNDVDAPSNYARFSVHLVDHSTGVCDRGQPFGWEASVRQG
jgi:hypothetical protein